MKRLLSIATAYPNPLQPHLGCFVARQMEALAERGEWDVTLINPIGIAPLSRRRGAAAMVAGMRNGVTVHRPRYTRIAKPGAPFDLAMIARAVLPLARRLHDAAAFDLVDAQYFYPDGPVAAQLARVLRLPLSIKARGEDINQLGRKAHALRRMKRAADQAGGLLAVSRALADEMGALGLPREKIIVHETGLDHARFRPLGRRQSRERLADEFGLDVPGELPLVATVGRMVPDKGQHLVIRALARLPWAHLLLVGDGLEHPALEALAREMGLSERVHFLGVLDHEHLAVVLSAANAMALPSASEGLANAWIEALACGTPLVITEVGGAREVVTGAQAGRIVARTEEAVAEGIAQILADPPPVEAVAACAERFSWETNGATLEAHYDALLDGS